MTNTNTRCWLTVVAMLLAGGAQVLRADQGAVTPPPGSPLLLEVSAEGVQIYTCEAKGDAFAWTFSGPDAKLADKQKKQVGTHFAGPTWKSNDGSSVVGEVVSKADAPDASAVPWLLLRAKSHERAGALAAVAFIRRADTKGGVAPGTGCDAAHVSKQARVPYTATYQFFGAAK
jgi:hypothetical protein